MNMHWIYTVPGSLVIAALLAWPVSRQDSEDLSDRIRFCLLSMLGGALLVWGFQQPLAGFHGDPGFFAVNRFVIAMMATAMLTWLWLGKIAGMVSDTLFGCVDFSDDTELDVTYETRQIEEAVQLFRRGKRRRALRLCNRIIESDSQYASTATTLAFWIENPGRLRLFSPARTTLRERKRF
jgi:hypothetical protein